MIVKCLDNNSAYYNPISDAVKFLENQYPIAVCFAGLVGSIPYMLNNNTSDLDICVIYSVDTDKRDMVHAIFEHNIKFKKSHLQPMDIDFFLNPEEEETCLNEFLLAPKLFNANILPGKGNYKLQWVISEIFISDHVYDDKHYIENHKEQIKQWLKIYDYLRCLYIYAYGRLENYLIGSEVRLRSYLNTAHDIFVIEYILNKSDIPSLNFSDLLCYCNISSTRDILEKLYICNKYSLLTKEQFIIPQIFELNEYFQKKLNLLKTRLEKLYLNKKNEIFEPTILYKSASSS